MTHLNDQHDSPTLTHYTMTTAVRAILFSVIVILIGTGIVIGWFTLGPGGNSADAVNFSAAGPDVSRVSMCQMMEDPVGYDSKRLEFNAVAYINYEGTIMLNPDDCLTKTEKLVTYPQLSKKALDGRTSKLKKLLESDANSKDDPKGVKIKVAGVAHSIDYDGQNIRDRTDRHRRNPG